MASVLRSVLSDTEPPKVGEMAQAENIAPPCDPGYTANLSRAEWRGL